MNTVKILAKVLTATRLNPYSNGRYSMGESDIFDQADDW